MSGPARSVRVALDLAVEGWEGVQVTDFAARRFDLAGQAFVVLAGALVPLVLVGLAGGGGSLGWVALAGGTACASGMLLGSTQRLLPALALAMIAAAALALAAAAAQRDAVEERPFPAATTGGDAGAGDDRARVTTATAERVRATAATAMATGARAAATVAPQPPPTPARFVRRHYADIAAGRFARAWDRLPPSARAEGFEAWRAGYATTLSQRVEDVRPEPDGFVRHDLVTVDRTPCGTTTERRYEVLWRLSPTDGDFTATYLEAVQLAGLDPEFAC